MFLFPCLCQHTVGWYRFRRNTSLEPSMRESTLHKTLLKTINTDTPHLFLLGLFTSGLSWNQSTHSFNYQLLTKGDRYGTLSPLTPNQPHFLLLLICDEINKLIDFQWCTILLPHSPRSALVDYNPWKCNF